MVDKICTNFGAELLKVIPGRVSTEVDAHLSYDEEGSYRKAHEIMELYAKRGIGPERIYIKLASTWEGIRACERLEKEGIACNLTLLFSFAQAAACADAGASLISPFVGRILDWHKKAHNKKEYPQAEDPGVISVTNIYNYYKKHDYKTIVMGASFRNVGEIQELAGCDNITIGPALLEELEVSLQKLILQLRMDLNMCVIYVVQVRVHFFGRKYDSRCPYVENCTDPLPRKLSVEQAKAQCDEPLAERCFNEEGFRSMHAEDACGSDKLPEGIESFAQDQEKLEAIIHDMASAKV